MKPFFYSLNEKNSPKTFAEIQSGIASDFKVGNKSVNMFHKQFTKY